MTIMKSHAERLFSDFNAKYFYGLIPAVKISYAQKHIQPWARFETHPRKGESILLSPILRDYQMALEGILLHEMVHAYLWVSYKDWPTDMAYMYLDHTEKFHDVERKVNKLHFGNARGHAKYYELMLADLKKKGHRLRA